MASLAELEQFIAGGYYEEGTAMGLSNLDEYFAHAWSPANEFKNSRSTIFHDANIRALMTAIHIEGGKDLF